MLLENKGRNRRISKRSSLKFDLEMIWKSTGTEQCPVSSVGIYSPPPLLLASANASRGPHGYRIGPPPGGSCQRNVTATFGMDPHDMISDKRNSQ